MKIKNIITAFLMLIIVLQALPVKHAFNYFLNDNYTAKESLPINNSETKSFKFLDDDQNLINEFHQPDMHLIFSGDKSYFHFTESLPALHKADIQTPPPNLV